MHFRTANQCLVSLLRPVALRPGHTVRLVLAAVTILLILVSTAGADPLPQDPLTDDPSKPWHITADTLDHDRTRNVYMAHGNVVIIKGRRRITADRVRFDQAAMNISAEGHVTLTVGEDRLTGDRLAFNLKTETGEIANGQVFLSEPHVYVSGKQITKTGPDTYAIAGATATRCDGPNPDWRITARQLNITIEGYGHAKHAAFWARSLPLAYSPYLFFPVKTKRQSGLLLPELTSSQRNGLSYQQPLYWAINEWSDATFYWHHLQHRGEKMGTEYRYRTGPASRGVLKADGLIDRQVDDGSDTATEKWGFSGDSYTRENRDRYWLRGRQDQELPWDIQAQLDLDFISDPDYLREFSDGMTGYSKTDRQFESEFGRGLDDPSSVERLNRFELSKTTRSSRTELGVDWIDNVVLRRSKASDTTLQRLPTISHSLLRTEIADTGVDASGTADYVHFFRQSGTRGHRTDIHPRLALPLRWSNYVSLEPSIGGRSTFWHLDTTENPNLERGGTYSRSIYDIETTANTEFYRVFGKNRSDGWRARHSIIPEIQYNYIPAQNQNQFPYFDGEDRIAPQNLVTYGITQTFTTRNSPSPPNPSGIGGPPPGTVYREVARLEIFQSYDIYKIDNDDPEPYSPVKVLGELSPLSGFSIRADGEWSVYDDRWVSHSQLLTFASNRNDRILLEHRYEVDESESISIEGRIRLFGGLSILGSFEHDLLEKEDIRSEIGFEFQRQCWSIDVRYTDDLHDRRYSIVLRLDGLGGESASKKNTSSANTP